MRHRLTKEQSKQCMTVCFMVMTITFAIASVHVYFSFSKTVIIAVEGAFEAEDKMMLYFNLYEHTGNVEYYTRGVSQKIEYYTLLQGAFSFTIMMLGMLYISITLTATFAGETFVLLSNRKTPEERIESLERQVAVLLHKVKVVK